MLERRRADRAIPENSEARNRCGGTGPAVEGRGVRELPERLSGEGFETVQVQYALDAEAHEQGHGHFLKQILELTHWKTSVISIPPPTIQDFPGGVGSI